MFDKLKLKSKAGKLKPSAPATSAGKAPSKKQIYQSRQNFGVNIGSCFVLEKWIFHELFPEGAECELDVATELSKKEGADGARERFEKFWNNFLSDDDWNWLVDHGVNSIRVPLGYWDVDEGKFTKKTKFEKVGPTVYKNAWSIFKSKFIEAAGLRNISVLVDIHGLPHGANGADHSGEKGSGKAEFWDNEDAQINMLDMFAFIAKDLKKYDNVCGIQIVNEAEFANDPKKQARFYAAAQASIREENDEIPIIISDGWWPDQWVKWIQSEQKDVGNLGFVLDHHCYRCFSDDDKNKSPDQIINDLDKDVLTNITDDGKGVDFMVGEYSCVLDGSSWDKNGANEKRDQLVIEYGNRQTEILYERATYGSYFWTFKFQSGNGGEWDYKTMTDKGALKKPLSFKGKNIPDQSAFESKLNENLSNHSNYWNEQNPNEKYEHDRYKEGFTTAWADASAFAKFDGSILGRVEAFKLARLNEHTKARGSLKHLWEWEQGYDAGLKEFQSFL